MKLEFEHWSDGAAPRVAAMAARPEMQPEFERLLGAAFAQTMADTWTPPAFRRVATVDGVDAGFAYAFVLPTRGRPFASIRVGVIEPWRRRGVGAALFEEIAAQLLREVDGLGEIESSVFVPAAGAEAFLESRGLVPTRKYWLMERPPAPVPPSEWPAGIEVRPFVNDDADVARFVDAFNRSWTEQDHGVLATVEDTRQQIDSGAVDPAGACFAMDGGEVAGFVRSAIFPTRGEVAVLGVIPEWRGRGLGRALLRLGVTWLVERGAAPITLAVDGANDRALRLYRQEGFEVLRTRQFFTRKL